MTTKAKLSDITKEIDQQAGSMLEEASRIRRNTESLMMQLRKQGAQFQREEEETLRQKKAEEQKVLASQHAKAWTMPDDVPEVEKAAEPVSSPVSESAAVRKEEKAEPEKKPASSVSGEKKQKPVKTEASEKSGKSSEKAEELPAAEKDNGTEKKNADIKPAESKAESARAEAVEAVQPVQPVKENTPVKPAPAARPVNAQPAQPGQYGRPANGQPGQYGRPANGQPGQYGRPANSQPGQYGRPANGQPGTFGRPAPQGGMRNAQGGAPQGRPAGAPKPAGAQRRSAPSQEMLPVMEKERVSNYDPNKKNYVRQHDPEHVAKNKKQLQKESLSSSGYNGYDDDQERGAKRVRVKKQPSVQQMMAPIKIEKAYMTADTITVKDLTERIGKPAGEILKKLFMLGIVSNINGELDFDTASLVCSEFGVELEMKQDKTAEDVLNDAVETEDSEENLQLRSPVITIMGHVDHGKTSLLDYIRKAKVKVTSTEAGGITQHIGAYTVDLNGRKITFLDTPGHEAFTAMRLRGAQATDIAVLVVAADDGVMPQTVEAINHARAADVPIIVAINKIDKPTANPDKVKQDLTKYNLVPEEWGGDTIMAPVSAVTGEGVDDLLEMILLQADVMQLRANPDRMARGVIIEAKLDKSRGPLATVLIQNGTLRVGDNIVAGLAYGRVRAMVNDRGERVQQAGPSTPVEVSGFAEVPSAGDEMMAVEDDRLSRQVVEERRDKLKASRVTTAKVSLDNLFAGITEGKVQNLNIIIKADVQGSVEAVKQALEKLSNDQVKVRVLHNAVGAITQDDVNLASAFNAIIIGFNIRPDATARDAAEKEGVDIRLYRIIYQAIEDVEKAMKGLLAPEYREVLLGYAEVRNVFKITGAGTIAGCYVQDGKVQRNAKVRLLRDNVVIFEGKLSSLRRFKDDVKECAQGYECGIGLENYSDIKESDIIECFVLEEIEK